MTDVLISENITGTPIDELKQKFTVSFQPELWKDLPRTVGGRGRGAGADRSQSDPRHGRTDRRGWPAGCDRAGPAWGWTTSTSPAVSAAGIVLTSTPSQNSVSVAELAIGLMLALNRKIVTADRHVRGGVWARNQFMGGELWGKTLGLIGLGRIGCMTARRAAAFGMDIAAYDPYADLDSPLVAEVRPRMLPLDELARGGRRRVLPRAAHARNPRAARSRSLPPYEANGRARERRAGRDRQRGRSRESLQEGLIAGAALDVRESEPPVLGALETMENVVLMPHLGAFTHEGQHRVTAAVCRDVAAVLTGRPAQNYVNFALPSRQPSQ